MTKLSWEDSGKGPRELTLADAHDLAITAGFVFSGDETLPPSKRANLQKMFTFLHVNSLSAFKDKFFAYELNPRLDTSPKHIWSSSSIGNEQYIGQMLGGKRHGQGLLLTRKCSSNSLYIGTFECGLRNGYGIVLTSRGETFHGYFKDDLMFGPGSYTFPRGQSELTKGRSRVRFDGMHNGRPLGKGVMVWSTGELESGEFDGMKLVKAVLMEDCKGVILMAEKNAEMAKRVASEIEIELIRQGLWEGEVVEELVKVRGGR